MFRKLVTLFAVLPAIAQGAGPADGIYYCNAATASGPAPSVYLTVNGQPDGQTIFAVAAVESIMPLFGYGIGQITGTTFSGTTGFGFPFNFTVDGNSLAGPITLSVEGNPTPAAVSCIKFW
jgi:hypothetical protein